MWRDCPPKQRGTMSQTTERVAPPWSLRGSGYIFLYRFSQDFVENHANIPDWLLPEYRGGFGAVMWVDYYRSPVGPYRELLLIPGRFQFGRRRYYMITKIYVSTQASVDNGQENWGIPKELADFEVEKVDERVRHLTASHNGTPFFQATTKTGLLRFPFNTVANPFPAVLLQRRERDGQFLSTEPTSGGTVSITATLQSLTVDEAHFPPVDMETPLVTVEAVNFRMTFPVPKEV
jgi:hypothetical protein